MKKVNPSTAAKTPLLKQIEIGLREVKEHQEGKRKLSTLDEFLDEIRKNQY